MRSLKRVLRRIKSVDNQITQFISLNQDYIIIALTSSILILIIIILIMGIVLGNKIKKMKRSYDSFMRGKDAETLEDSILKRFEDIDLLMREEKTNKESIKNIEDNLLITYQKVGIVKYDAFKEMGGKLSFALVLLNNKNNGFIMNAMHSREGCYTYIKEIIKGESYIVLSEEEKEALQIAINSNNIMIH